MHVPRPLVARAQRSQRTFAENQSIVYLSPREILLATPCWAGLRLDCRFFKRRLDARHWHGAVVGGASGCDVKDREETRGGLVSGKQYRI